MVKVGKRGREVWEGGCTTVREPWCRVNHLGTSNLHPCIAQCLLRRNVHIWKPMYCCPAFLRDVLWRLRSNPAELTSTLFLYLSWFALLRSPSDTWVHSLIIMLRCCPFGLSSGIVPPPPRRRPNGSEKLSLFREGSAAFFQTCQHHNLGQPETCSKLS